MSSPSERLRVKRGAAALKLGDRLAEKIERRILTPAEAKGGVIAETARKLRRCGGCRADRRALNGGGDLPGDEIAPVV